MTYTFDSREVKPGMGFVALKGEKADGHDFIPKALAAGAAEIVDGLEALQAKAKARRKALKAKVIALTGSAGKTTTKELLRAFLSTVGKTHATAGNFNNHIGLPLTILNCPDDADFLVLEMGTNHPGEIAALCDIAEPDAGLVTNIGTAHLEFFKTQDGIADEKGTLFRRVRDFAVVSSENVRLERLKALCAVPLEVVDPHSAWLADALADVLPGAHNVSNAALAFAVAARFGATREGAVAALAAFALPGARWRKTVKDGVTYIDDSYNANPDSMIAALDAFAATPCAGKRVAVLGDMGELGADALALHRKVFAHAMALGIPLVIGVGELSSQCLCHLVYKTIDPLRKKFRLDVSSGDLVLVKASHAMNLSRLLKPSLGALAAVGVWITALADVAGWTDDSFVTQRVTVRYADAAAAARAAVSFAELPAGRRLGFATRWDDQNRRHLKMAAALESVGARATFYVNGSPEGYAGTMKKLLAGGHSIGAHTLSHPFLGRMTPFGVFREVLESRIRLEVASQSPVTLFTLPYGSAEFPDDPETSRRIGDALVRSGYVGGPEGRKRNDAFGFSEARWCGPGYLSINDRAPDAKLFAEKMLALTNAIAAGAAPYGPFVTLGTHTWQTDDGLGTLAEIVRPLVARKDVYSANGNACAARRLAALSASARRVSQKGNAAVYEIRRLAPRVLGSDEPLQLVFSEKPVSVTAEGRAVADGALAVASDARGPTAFVLVANALKADASFRSFAAELKNGTKEAWRDLVCTLRLPPGFEPGVQVRTVARLAPGETLPLAFDAAWTASAPLPTDDFFAAVQVDCKSASGASERRWLTGAISRFSGNDAVPRDQCLVAGPFDGAEKVDFAAFSVPGAALAPIGEEADGRWRAARRAPGYRTICVEAQPGKGETGRGAKDGVQLALAVDFSADTAKDGSVWRLRFATQSLPSNPHTVYLNGKSLPGRPTELELRNGANRLVIVHPYVRDYNRQHILSIVSVQTGAPPIFSRSRGM